jgi:hypothetical protein
LRRPVRRGQPTGWWRQRCSWLSLTAHFGRPLFGRRLWVRPPRRTAW